MSAVLRKHNFGLNEERVNAPLEAGKVLGHHTGHRVKTMHQAQRRLLPLRIHLGEGVLVL